MISVEIDGCRGAHTELWGLEHRNRFFFLLVVRGPPCSTLFPYAALFGSENAILAVGISDTGFMSTRV